MRKVIASGAIIVYMISVVTFCLLLPKEGEKATATDFGVMCINAVYPSASIELADSRDNEDVPGEEGGGTDQETSGGDDADNEEKSDPDNRRCIPAPRRRHCGGAECRFYRNLCERTLPHLYR